MSFAVVVSTATGSGSMAAIGGSGAGRGAAVGSVVVDITGVMGFKATGASRNDGDRPTVSGLNGGSEPPRRPADALGPLAMSNM